MAVTYQKTFCSLFFVASSLFFVFLVIINIQFFIYLLSTIINKYDRSQIMTEVRRKQCLTIFSMIMAQFV